MSVCAPEKALFASFGQHLRSEKQIDDAKARKRNTRVKGSVELAPACLFSTTRGPLLSETNRHRPRKSPRSSQSSAFSSESFGRSPFERCVPELAKLHLQRSRSKRKRQAARKPQLDSAQPRHRSTCGAFEQHKKRHQKKYKYSCDPTFPTRLKSVPIGYEIKDMSVRAELKKTHTCAACGQLYSGAFVGSLACTFHPYQTYLECKRSTQYSEQELAQCSCLTCAKASLPRTLRSARTFGSGERSRLNDGCTRIDHSSNIDRIFDMPVVAFPTFYARHLRLRGSESHLTGYFLDESAGNIMLISQPEQMAATLQYTMPGLHSPQHVRVVDLYELMAVRFGLQQLRDSISRAKKGPVGSSVSRLPQLRHKDASRKFNIYARETVVAEFVPFYIIVRVQQQQPLELI